MDMLKDANWDSDLFIKLSDNRVKKAGKKIVKGLADLYQAEDDFWKIFAFKNESARYEDILIKDMGMSKDEAERYIANIVTNTYPTYSKIPESIKRLRRFPLVGTFVSFHAESVRTLYNSITLAKQEMTHKNPKIKMIGAQRMAGGLSYFALREGIANYFTVKSIGASGMLLSAITGLFGDDDDDTAKKTERAARLFLPPWLQFSKLMYTEVGDGKIKVYDAGASDPHGVMDSFLNALLLAEDTDEALVDAWIAVTKPFLSTDILTSQVLDIHEMMKSKEWETYTGNEKVEWLVKLTLKTFEPGTSTTARRIIGAEKGERGSEIMAAGTGIRPYDVDVLENGMPYKVYEFRDRVDGIKKKYWKDKKTETQEDATTNAIEKLKEQFDLFNGIYEAAILLGVKKEDIDEYLMRLSLIHI